MVIAAYSAALLYSGHRFSNELDRLEDLVRFGNAPVATGYHKRPYDLQIVREIDKGELQIFLYDPTKQTKVAIKEDLYPPTGDMLKKLGERGKDAAECEVPAFLGRLAEKLVQTGVSLRLFHGR